MSLRRTKIINLALVGFLAAASDAHPARPLDRLQVLVWMDFGGGSSRVVQLVRRAGTNFQPRPDDLKLLEELGATPSLLETLQNARPAAAPPAPAPDEQAAFTQVSSCLTMAVKGNVAAAEKDCEAATSYEPAVTYFALGEARYQAGRMQEALKAFKSAEKADRDVPETHNYIGLLLATVGNVDGARKEFNRAMRLDPEYATPHVNLALIFLLQKHYDAAEQEIRTALQLDADNAWAHDKQASLLIAKYHNLAGAIAEFRKAAELYPKAVSLHVDLAGALAGAGDYDGAIAEYRRALELDPTSAAVHVPLAAVLLRKHLPDEAISECHAAGQHAPDNNQVREVCEDIHAQATRMKAASAGPSGSPSERPAVAQSVVTLPPGSRGASGDAAKELLAMKPQDFPALHDQARNGDAHAQALVCIAYRLGHFVKQDDAAALDWCLKAARQNDPAGEEDVGVQYAYGRGTKQDTPLAVEWLKKAASQGSVAAMGNLGTLYATGAGVPQDYAEAMKWYRTAADRGDPRSQTDVGIMYLLGQGVKTDRAEARKWIHKSAHSNYGYAEALLGMIYLQGFGARKDPAEALHWLQKGAAHGDARAQSELGWMYANGVEVPRDFALAVKWYRAAAEQGDAGGAYGLGVRYLLGQGVERDYAQAEKWLRMAADAGHGDAAYNLGLIYLGAFAEAPRPPDQAAKYFQIAAAQGIGDAQCTLAGLYSQGSGVPKDNVAAYEWTLLATRHGTEQCGRGLKALESQMRPEQIQEAKRRAATWKATPHPAFNY